MNSSSLSTTLADLDGVPAYPEVPENVEPQIKVLEADDTYGKYEIEPLEPGFGTTLGNSLRRVLLSSLKGSAVSSIAVEGIPHEFSDIPGVKEDTSEIILNIKMLRVQSVNPDPVKLHIDVKGERVVTGADIQLPSDVSLINPEQHIATLDNSDSRFAVELTVERGKGYVPADKNKKEGQPIGVIPIDAIFSPVRKVNFLVEKTRVGQMTDYDRLILEVWSDGTITPAAALGEAAELLAQRLSLFSGFTEEDGGAEEKGGAGRTQVSSKVSEAPIEELDLSVRAYNCLKANDIFKVGDLLRMSEAELMGLRNFGRKSLDEIKEKLVAKGFVTPDQLETLFQ